MESKAITSTKAKTNPFKSNTTKSVQAEFLPIISHALRAPLDTLTSIAHLLQNQKLNTQELHSYGEFISQASQDLLSLADDILTLLTCTNLFKNKAELIDLEQLIEQIIHANAYRAQQQGIELTLSYASLSPKKVLAAPRRLRQLMMILLNNALNSTHTGYVHISVSSKATPRARTRIQVVISDTGIGIHEDHLKDLQLKLNPSLAPQKKHETSYNLAIASFLAEQLGSRVVINSVLGKGTTVSFTLPTAESDAKLDDKAWSVLAGLKCMLIDDNSVRRQLIEQQLAKGDIHVKALSTDDFLLILPNLLGNEPYQLALINTDGYNQHTAYLGRILRNSASFQQCLLVLSTTQILLDYEREQALTSGYNCVLSTLADAELLPQLAEAWQTWLRKQPISELRNIAKQQHILLVEDNPLSQKVNSLLLNEMGFVVDIAIDGQTALNKLAKQSYDLVLMDINLPDINGLEVTSRYRQQEKSTQHTPIIGLTSQTQGHSHQLSLAAGMDDYMPKPLLSEHLQILFNKWLNHKTEAA